MRATMTTNVVVAVVLFATAGAHAQECTRKLIAMLKAWKIKSQFSRLDDLIFPNCEGRTSATIISSSGHSCRCSTCSRRSAIQGRARTLRGIMLDRPGSRRRRFGFAGGRRKSRWIDTGTYSRATITGRRSTRLPRDYSRRARRTLGELPCAIRVTWTRRYKATQDGKGLISLGFDNIAHRCEVRLNSAHAKAR